MKRFVTLIGGLVGAWLLGPMGGEAAAVDLTGTWTGTEAARCHGLVSGDLPAAGPIAITLKIAPEPPGVSVCVNLNRTDLNEDLNGPHHYLGTFFSKSPRSNTSHATLTAKGTVLSGDKLSGAVGSLTSSFDKVEGVLKLKGALISGDGTSALSCTFKNLTRTSTDNPGAACP